MPSRLLCMAADRSNADIPYERRDVRNMQFHVTDAGRKALAEHLKTIADPWRLYAVTFEGFITHVSGKSHSCAKYSHYLDIADALSDLTFGEYLKGARCRLVASTGAAT